MILRNRVGADSLIPRACAAQLVEQVTCEVGRLLRGADRYVPLTSA